MSTESEEPKPAPITPSSHGSLKRTRGRPSKDENGEKPIAWSNSMVEELMELRFKKFYDFFKDSKHSHRISDGWNRIAYELCKVSGQNITKDKARQKYQQLNKKWRDHKPSGKESTRTGNEDPGDNVKDQIFEIILPYFSKFPGCGTSLGQATDINAPESQESEREEDSPDVAAGADSESTPCKKKAKVESLTNLVRELPIEFKANVLIVFDSQSKMSPSATE